MTALLRAFLCFTLLPLIRLLYRLRVLHADRVPAEGGLLLVANHVSYLDAILLYGACPRPVRFVMVSRFMGVKAISWFLNLFGVIPITPGRARDAIRATAQCLRNGDVVGIFPEGQLTRTGTMNELKKGFTLIARQAGVPVQPVYLHGLWGSIFSFERGRVLGGKWPIRMPWPVVAAFGEPRAPAEATVDWARDALLALSAEAFGAMPALESSLAAAVVRGLKRRPGAVCFSERGANGPPRRLRRHLVLATAVSVAASWKSVLPDDEHAVGVLLPAGTAPVLINLGLILAGRVPVNLPFPAGAEGALDAGEISAAIRAAGLRTVITSRAFLGALEQVRWPDPETPGQFLDMAAGLSGAGLGRRLLERLLAFVEPAWLTVRRLGLPRKPSPDPVWACVTDGGARLRGSADTTVLAQALRLNSGNWIERGEALFTEEGLSTPSGALWSLWLPVLHRHAAAGRSWSARNDAALIETVCREQNVRRLVLSQAAAAALAALEEPWHPAQRSALHSVIVPTADAGGLPAALDPVESITGAPLCPAWVPEAMDGGVIAISQPDPNPEEVESVLQLQEGRRAGSSGRLLPGIAARVSAENGELELRGPGLGDGDSWRALGGQATLDASGFLALETKSESKSPRE